MVQQKRRRGVAGRSQVWHMHSELLPQHIKGDGATRSARRLLLIELCNNAARFELCNTIAACLELMTR